MRKLVGLALLLASCGASDVPLPESTAVASTPAPVTTSTVAAPPPAVAATSAPTSPSTTTSTAPPTTAAAPTAVSTAGTYNAPRLHILIRFDSRIDGVSSRQLADQALTILNDPSGWNQSGFTFAEDPSSDLAVVLAEGPIVDELCLPLETYGKVSCQNGPVVALNADRWRLAGDDWDGTVESYRTYLINHEVGHLIGLRHPVERCPTESKTSALMEPQTNNLLDCVGNGTPLGWEVAWAKQRPAVVGPDPEWDGPRPSWPAG